jgi:hypothetical protein
MCILVWIKPFQPFSGLFISGMREERLAGLCSVARSWQTAPMASGRLQQLDWNLNCWKTFNNRKTAVIGTLCCATAHYDHIDRK